MYISISEGFKIPPIGGHVVWLHQVSTRLKKVQLLTAKCDGQPDLSTYEGVDIKRISLSRWEFVRPESLPLYTKLFFHLFWGAVLHRPDAFISARVLPEGIVANAVGRLLGIPSAMFVHGEEVHRVRWDKPLPNRRKGTTFLKRKLLWRTIKGADLIIANSNFTAGLLKDGLSDSSKISVVHPGTDPKRFHPMEKDHDLARELGVQNKKVIFTLGRLVIRKGQDVMIKAMPEILKQVPDAVYLVAGKGNYEKELRSLAKSLNVSDHVIFMGLADDDILPRLYNLADVFIMANRQMPGSGDLEGFGIVFLEAGACGIPVIGGQSGGVPDAVVHEKTGLLVDGHSVSEVAESVIRILKNKKEAKIMGANGRKRVCEELSWDHSAEKIEQLLSNLASKKPN